MDWLKKTDDLSEIRNGCEKVADRAVKDLGAGTKYLQITPAFGNQLGPVLGQHSGWYWHVAAIKDGRVFDRLTGSKGMLLSEYKKLFEYNDSINFFPSAKRTLK